MAELRFLADMNISPLTVRDLQKLGWEIVRVSEVMNTNSKDATILDYARQQNLVLITQDLDFSKLLALGGHSKPSVISIRLENAVPDVVTTRIVDVVAQLSRELADGAVISVDEVSARYRLLPLFLS